ncbi:hypothetical protein ABK040_014094 [Willaertia magna]
MKEEGKGKILSEELTNDDNIGIFQWLKQKFTAEMKERLRSEIIHSGVDYRLKLAMMDVCPLEYHFEKLALCMDKSFYNTINPMTGCKEEYEQISGCAKLREEFLAKYKKIEKQKKEELEVMAFHYGSNITKKELEEHEKRMKEEHEKLMSKLNNNQQQGLVIPTPNISYECLDDLLERGANTNQIAQSYFNMDGSSSFSNSQQSWHAHQQQLFCTPTNMNVPLSSTTPINNNIVLSPITEESFNSNDPLQKVFIVEESLEELLREGKERELQTVNQFINNNYVSNNNFSGSYTSTIGFTPVAIQQTPPTTTTYQSQTSTSSTFSSPLSISDLEESIESNSTTITEERPSSTSSSTVKQKKKRQKNKKSSVDSSSEKGQLEVPPHPRRKTQLWDKNMFHFPYQAQSSSKKQ